MLSFRYGQNDIKFTHKDRHRGTNSFCPKRSEPTRGADLWLSKSVTTTWLIAPVATKYNNTKCKRSAGQTNLISAQTLRQGYDNLEFGHQPTGMPLTYHIVTVKTDRNLVHGPERNQFMDVKSMERLVRQMAKLNAGIG